MNRWKNILKLIMAFGLFFGLNSSLSTPVSAAIEGCVEYSDGLRCADPYCQQGTMTCNADGSRCYCGAGLPDENETCRIATGSVMYFTKQNRTDKFADKIVLSGGIWKPLIQSMPDGASSEYGINKERGEIVFKRIQTFGVDKAQYSSSFLDYFAEKIDGFSGYGWGMGIEVKFDNNSDSATVTNQFFEKKAGSKTERCIQTTDANGNPFTHKLTDLLNVSLKPSDNSTAEAMACDGAPELIKRIIFGDKRKEFLLFTVEEQALIGGDILMNCVDYVPDENAEIDTKDVGIVISRLLVDQKIGRTIYLKKDSNDINSFMGYDFPALNKSDDFSLRLDKVKEIDNRCTTSCNVDDIIKRYGTIDSPEARQALNNFVSTSCEQCPPNTSDRSYILNELRLEKNKTKSFSDLVVEKLVEDRNEPNCTVISPGYGYNYDTSGVKTAGYKSGSTEGIIDIEPPVSEAELNQKLPQLLISMCEKYPGSNEDRIACKYNALQCYQKSMAVDLGLDNICSQINGEQKNARWALCPSAATGAKLANEIEYNKDKIMELSPSLLNEKTEIAWGYSRNIANIGLVFAFMAVIFSYITGIGLTNYQIKKSLPRIIVIAILINISIYLLKISLDLSNIAGAGIKNLIASFSGGTKEINIGTYILRMGIGATVGAGAVAYGLFSLFNLILLAILVVIIAILFIIFLFSFRQFVVIASAIMLPIALLMLLLPGGQNFFKKWLKYYSGILLIYPLSAFIFGSAEFVRALNSETKSIPGLIAVILPYAAILAIPKIIIGLVNQIPEVGAKLSGSLNGLPGMAKKASSMHMLSKDLDQEAARKRKTAFDRIPRKINQNQGGLGSKWLGSRKLNSLTYGAGDKVLLARKSQNYKEQKGYRDLLSNDNLLYLSVMNGENSSEYSQLNEAQKVNYNLIKSRGGKSDFNFHLASIANLANNMVSDKTYYDLSEQEALRAGATMEEIDQSFRNASFFAKSNGDIETMAMLAVRNDPNAFTKPVISPGKQAEEISDILGTDTELAELLVTANGNLDLMRSNVDIRSKFETSLNNLDPYAKKDTNYLDKDKTGNARGKKIIYEQDIINGSLLTLARNNKTDNLEKHLERIQKIDPKNSVIMARSLNQTLENAGLPVVPFNTSALSAEQKETYDKLSPLSAYEIEIDKTLNKMPLEKVNPTLFGNKVDPIYKNSIPNKKTETFSAIVRKINQPIIEGEQHYLNHIASSWSRLEIRKKSSLKQPIIDRANVVLSQTGTRRKVTTPEDAFVVFRMDIR